MAQVASLYAHLISNSLLHWKSINTYDTRITCNGVTDLSSFLFRIGKKGKERRGEGSQSVSQSAFN